MVVLKQVLVLFTFASVFVWPVVFAESTQLGSQAAASGGGLLARTAGAERAHVREDKLPAPEAQARRCWDQSCSWHGLRACVFSELNRSFALNLC